MLVMKLVRVVYFASMIVNRLVLFVYRTTKIVTSKLEVV
jgi:hypothetical protein